jgi:hypothetical protein
LKVFLKETALQSNLQSNNYSQKRIHSTPHLSKTAMAHLLNGQPPEFTGFDLIAQPVNKWLKRFNRWIILNNIGIARKREIMESVLDSPALDMYLLAIAAEGDLHEELVAPVDAAAQLANWGHIETWFRDSFNDEEHQQVL